MGRTWLEFAGIDLEAAGALMREASLAPKEGDIPFSKKLD
jgi:hypothetical protein